MPDLRIRGVRSRLSPGGMMSVSGALGFSIQSEGTHTLGALQAASRGVAGVSSSALGYVIGGLDSSMWTAVPELQFTEGVPAVISLTPYLVKPDPSDHLVLDIDIGALPAGVTLDRAGQRLIYDGSGLAATSQSTLMARNDALYWRISENTTRTQSSWQYYRLTELKNDAYKWQTYGGDWVDSLGVNQGTTPFSTVFVDVAVPVEKLVTLSLTALAQHWDTTADEICAVIIKGNANTTKFRSKNYLADPAKRPILTVVWDDDTTEDFSPTADVTFAGSDTPEDMNEFLLVSNSFPALLQFYRPALLKKRVQSAALKLWCYEQTVSITLSAYQVRIPVNREEQIPAMGIANSYVLDAGIAANPSVLFFDGFESPTWKADGSWYARADDDVTQTLTRSASNLPGSSWCAESTIRSDPLNTASFGGTAGKKYLASHPDEVYCRYYLKLDPNCSGAFDGGKFPGLSGLVSADWGINNPQNTGYQYAGWPNGTQAASLIGIRAAATGTDFAPTTQTALDGFAHQVTIRNNSGTNHSAKTATVTGTAWDGTPLVRAQALPGAGLTTTNGGWFKTVTSIVVSASIGADTMDIGWALPADGGALANGGDGTGQDSTGGGTRGWSARCGHYSPPRQGTLIPLPRFTPRADHSVQHRTYMGTLDVYTADTAGYGMAMSWGMNGLDLNFLEYDRWYCIEQRIKVNTPGVRNGIYQAWIDGVQVAEKLDFYLRASGWITQHMSINAFWFAWQHGGTAIADSYLTMYMDNLVIASEYIGPMRLA